MTPLKFTIKDGVTYFHYNYSELREFVRLGKSNGNVGVILVKREKDFLTYKGFGSIENPFTSMVSITIRHIPSFDGKMLSDEERLIPPVSFFPNVASYKMIFYN